MSEPQSLALLDHLALLQDPRLDRQKRHHLVDILFIAICAVISGANDFVAMEKFGKTKRAWLEKFLALPNGIPSHDTFGRVFALLDPEQLLRGFLAWVETLRQATQGQFVGLDGKTLRASLDAAAARNPLHVVSAWASANRLVLGQVAVDQKSNEITAIPQLLEMLELQGAIVTIDAMGCQKTIAATIQDQGADYVLTVKGNQDHLEEDILAHFAALDQGEVRARGRSVSEQREQGHGRQEYRRCEAVPVPKTLRARGAWPGLQSIARVTRVYTEKGTEKSEVRYFISSLKAEASLLAQAIRSHWGIENGLHWVLDMYFAEDRSRARTLHAAANLAQVRRWVVSLLRQDTKLEGSIEKKRLQAAWNDKNLEILLGLC